MISARFEAHRLIIVRLDGITVVVTTAQQGREATHQTVTYRTEQEARAGHGRLTEALAASAGGRP